MIGNADIAKKILPRQTNYMREDGQMASRHLDDMAPCKEGDILVDRLREYVEFHVHNRLHESAAGAVRARGDGRNYHVASEDTGSLKYSSRKSEILFHLGQNLVLG